MLCCDTARGRHLRCLACLRSHVLRAYCNFESKEANSITLYGDALTNLCMALLTFSLFCFVLYCYAFVQYCNVNTIQYNAMHKFVRVLDNPPNNKRKTDCSVEG